MEYKVCLLGGPCDGTQETSHYGQRYQTVIGRQLVENGLTRIGIYVYQDSHESERTTERRYQYEKTYPIAEGLRRLEQSESR